MKKIFALFLSFVMMATAVPAAFAIDAADSLEGSSNESKQMVNLEERLIVQVEPGQATFSERTNEMLESVSQNVEQVVYQVDAGKDVYTIGYIPGSIEFDVDEMKENIQTMVDSINQDIETVPELEGNHTVRAQDLELTQVIFDATVKEQVAIKETFSSISESAETAKSEIQRGLIKQAATQAAMAASHTINGSYHYKVSSGGNHTSTWWHNGATNQNIDCSKKISLTSPHGGDGNSRYNATTNTYKWYPSNMRVWFKNNVDGSNKNKVTLQYNYSTTQLSYLKRDSNEALELSVVFYDYTNSSDSAYRGHTYMKHEAVTYSTTQPNAYLDTPIFDSGGEVDFCVGVHDVSALKANTDYRWSISAKEGIRQHYEPNDGRFKIQAQRSYKVASAGSAYTVFSEEHEKILSLGLLANQSWVPNLTAWSLGVTSQTSWNFDASKDPVRPVN